MLHSRITAVVCLLTCACLVGGASRAAAQEKKKETAGKEVLFHKAEALADTDDKDTKLKNSYRKTYKVTLDEKKAYRIDVTSKDFDTVLRLENSEGKEVAFNDDIDTAKKILDSRILFYAPKTGEYRIIVTTFDRGKTGDFLLEMKAANKEETAEAILTGRLNQFVESSMSEQKALIRDMTKTFQEKGDKLTFKDAQIAAQLSVFVDDSDIAYAREVGETFSKIFSGAEDKQVATLPKFIEGMLKKLERVGTAIEIAGKTTDGKDFDLKDLKGKVVLVDFWATWCGPCIQEMPNIIEAHKKYHAKGFEVIGVSLDRKDEAIVKFLEVRKLPWGSLNIEDSRKLADKYDVNSIPQPILVGRDGRVVSMRSRGPLLQRQLERLMNEKK